MLISLKSWCCLQSNSGLYYQRMFSYNTWRYFFLIMSFSPQVTMNMKSWCISFTSLYGPLKYLLHSSQDLRLESTLQLCHSLSGKFSNTYNSSEKLKQYFSPSFIQLSVPKHCRWHCHSFLKPCTTVIWTNRDKLSTQQSVHVADPVSVS